MSLVEVVFEDARWRDAALVALAERAVQATLTHLGQDGGTTEIALLACDDARIADLNAEFRDKPSPTNVLSWPAQDLAAEKPGARPTRPEADPDGTVELGDIALAWETCNREAREQGKAVADHVTHLVVHGVLHLLGYDHVHDADAELMEATETEILGKMGLDDPYRA
ncbi:rRNA maturation RNase YbeY [Sulfitobacter sp. D35]|uniref:rRNA maturation RNase YbeY n=1 Tax=Sulfitobacter sp. D35 TaxID=3083252 RepID=UPI00296EAA20|nr:rRNA maturation RNase YbeY [Sulfitobacter sp. D35]MDW4498681.1 rRNA maturation RNase YbeY [Sulfitobacter sp. D35]